MAASVELDTICVPSEDVVYRDIEGDVVIIPLAAGIGDSDDELYSLNETGRAIWHLLDGRRTLAQVADLLEKQFESGSAEVRNDVVGFAAELVRRRILSVKA